MGGGYVECGEFLGENKSGSAFTGVLEGILSVLPAEEQTEWKEDFLAAVEELEDDQMISISPDLVALLIDPLKTYYRYLQTRLQAAAPIDPIALDANSGIDPTEAKWGAGDGWRLYCAHDLVKACEVSLQTGESVIISFD